MTAPELHSSIIALVSLSAGIASKHPDMGLCQIDKLRHAGINETQISTVIEIARHIRDEAAQKLDAVFDAKAYEAEPVSIATVESCCSSTSNGQSCC